MWSLHVLLETVFSRFSSLTVYRETLGAAAAAARDTIQPGVDHVAGPM